jgi:hypothetical protein
MNTIIFQPKLSIGIKRVHIVLSCDGYYHVYVENSHVGKMRLISKQWDLYLFTKNYLNENDAEILGAEIELKKL